MKEAASVSLHLQRTQFVCRRSTVYAQSELNFCCKTRRKPARGGPRLKYKWPAATWAAIENGQIVLGMTMDQVRMSWGEPEKITRTAAGEQWRYPGGVLLFKNGVMSGKQN